MTQRRKALLILGDCLARKLFRADSPNHSYLIDEINITE
jgi:hypothetical protein